MHSPLLGTMAFVVSAAVAAAQSSGPVTPPLTADGIVEAAGYGALSPGTLASIFNNSCGYAAAPMSAQTLPWPTVLNNVSVSVNGANAPIFYVDPCQINFQLPWETPVGNATILVTVGSSASNSVSVPVLTAAPGLFIFGGNPGIPQNEAIVENADYSVNGPNNPAMAGSFIVAYINGAGPVKPPATDGTAAPLSPLSWVTSAYSATLQGPNPTAFSSANPVDGFPVTVLFAGLTPGFSGLEQMNIMLPSYLATGTYFLWVTVNGASSNAASITVAANPNPGQAPACATFPANFIPFASVAYVSAADPAGDRLLVGSLSGTDQIQALQIIVNMPLPAVTNQEYCGTVTLAPGYSVVAYVPTALERQGNFSAFAGLFTDPFAGNLPFPGGIVPTSLLPSAFAWRIAPVGAPAPHQ